MFSHLVLLNKVNTYDWFKEHLQVSMILRAMTSQINNLLKLKLDHESLVKGIVYQDTTTPSYESQISELEHEGVS